MDSCEGCVWYAKFREPLEYGVLKTPFSLLRTTVEMGGRCALDAQPLRADPEWLKIAARDCECYQAKGEGG